MQLNINTPILPALSDYIAYDILFQYLRELVDQARMQMNGRNFPEDSMKMLRDNISEASRQLESLQQTVQVKSNVLMDLDRQMTYLRQQTSGQLQERFQQNTRFTVITPETQGSNTNGR